MNVLFLPANPNGENPYIKLLSESLQRVGIGVFYSWIFPKALWLVFHKSKINIIHIHWPSYLYRLNGLTYPRILIVLARFFLAKLLGYKIVWTAHNLMPHETNKPWLDRLFRKILIRYGNGVIFHCQEAYHQITAAFGHSRVNAIIPHGNYDGCYPPLIKQYEARTRLNIPHNYFVFLYFGNIRNYKGVGKLISEFKRIRDPNTVLIIAGKAVNEEKDKISSCCEGDKNIHLFLEHIKDDKVPILMSAADVVVAPYEATLTSGVAHLALTFGRPLIAPRLGCLPELIQPEYGILYDTEIENGLFAAMSKIRSANLSEMSLAARKRAMDFDWEEIGILTAKFYNHLLESGKSSR